MHGSFERPETRGRQPEVWPGNVTSGIAEGRNSRAEDVKSGGNSRQADSMDMTWVTDRIAVGGGIWNAGNMAALAQAGVTHILNMQIEFDDRPLAERHGIRSLWNPTDDNFLPKPPELFERGVEFGLEALEDPNGRLYVHCAAGVHRAPMMTLALLCVLDWQIDPAMQLIESRRPVVDFADVYVESVRRFLEWRAEGDGRGASAEAGGQK